MSAWLTRDRQPQLAEAGQVVKSVWLRSGRVSFCLDFTVVAVSGSISEQKSVMGASWESTCRLHIPGGVRCSADAAGIAAVGGLQGHVAGRVCSLDELYEAEVTSSRIDVKSNLPLPPEEMLQVRWLRRRQRPRGPRRSRHSKSTCTLRVPFS